jgi:hypothetical protein
VRDDAPRARVAEQRLEVDDVVLERDDGPLMDRAAHRFRGAREAGDRLGVQREPEALGNDPPEAVLEEAIAEPPAVLDLDHAAASYHNCVSSSLRHR